MSLLATSSPAMADQTYNETTGGAANTWTDYNSAGGTAGPRIAANQTVQIACKLAGFRVQDGNTWWYRIASTPWNSSFYVSADAFYNNGSTSGSLLGTPYVDSAVPDCSSLPTGSNETAGGVANTWADYQSAGGAAGPQIAAHQTVQIACKITGFTVADGNTWWYQIASAPWSSNFYVSADAFYNNGATSGTLIGTPFVDSAVPDCAGNIGGSTGTKPSPSVTLSQGPVAPAGFRYAVSLAAFSPNTRVSITCYDSVSPGGFYTFSLTTNSNGAASTQSYCYSGDGPDHWVVAGGIRSNSVAWGAGVGGPGTVGGTGASGNTAGTGNGSGAQLPNPSFNRSAAVSWALAHAKDKQYSGTLCTWFVSQALWAGGVASTSTWNTTSKGSAVYVDQFVNYAKSQMSASWIDITSNLSTNKVPQAVAGDVIVYNWNDGGDVLDHMSLVVNIADGQYPQIAEWGQLDFSTHPWYKVSGGQSPYVVRGWTYSEMHHMWLQKEHPGMKAYLLHIPGGYFVPNF